MIPMTAEIMRGLKAKKEEDVRRFQVQSLVKHIYSQAVYKATTTIDTSYTHQCFPIHQSPEICFQNITEVVLSLRDLFPGCMVTSSAFAKDHDGTLRYIEDSDYASLNINYYITVDWH